MIPLAFRDLGGAGRPPLAILHGFMGSARNWSAAGRDLARWFHVHALDLRNHGASPHTEVHDYPALASDVTGFLRAQLDGPAWLLGHSMGGKVAMRVACRHPELIAGLIVVDIAPRDYFSGTLELHVAPLLLLDLAKLPSREDAERQLEHAIRDWTMRKFLLTNLERANGGGWRWQNNLGALVRHLRAMELNPLDAHDHFGGPTLFAFGADSGYYENGDHERIARHFPAAAIEFIAGAGHNPHFDQRERFASAVGAWAKDRRT